MTRDDLTMRDIAYVAGTRALFGVGLGLLLSERLPADKRKTVGWTLLAIGAITTIPIILTAKQVFGPQRHREEEPDFSGRMASAR